MAKNTGKPLKKIQEDMERDYWMTAEEAKKYGLVDAVITPNKKVVLRVKKDLTIKFLSFKLKLKK